MTRRRWIAAWIALCLLMAVATHYENRLGEQGFAYTSSWRVLDLPVVSIAIDRHGGETLAGSTANGWIAVGQIALGRLVGVGVCATGFFALGVVALGVVSAGVCALGCAGAAGVCALGWRSAGVLAIGRHCVGKRIIDLRQLDRPRGTGSPS
jgi:hypothetical protein